MVKIYNTNIETNALEELSDFEKSEIRKGSWISMVNPSKEEVEKIAQKVNINQEFITDALDFEEKARIEIDEEDITLLIIDVPIIEKKDEVEIFTTMPLGMIVVRDEYFITVSINKNSVIENFEEQRIKSFSTYKKTRFIFQILYYNAAYYLHHLGVINKESEIAENILKKSMKNKELLKILNLQKSLVYFTTSLKSNELVMEKVMRGKMIKLYDEDEDLLEDAIIENKQAMEMAQIYSNILNQTMNAYSSIISNNLNGVMKYLTSITIVLAIPTMVSSFWGMNVAVPIPNLENSFWIICALSLIITILVTMWLKKKDMFN